jgi:hypothetical protein
MKQPMFCARLLQAVAAASFAFFAHSAQAVFVSGNFDPPDLSGTHTFQLLGNCLHSGTYVLAVNNEGACDVTLTRLTVVLDHSFSLDFSSFLPFTGINSIQVTDGNMTGVDTSSIGPAVGSGAYPGNWWIDYYFGSNTDPVELFHNCPNNTTGSGCLVDTAFTVTFFLSDANGRPIPEPWPLALLGAALGASWLGRRRVFKHAH